MKIRPDVAFRFSTDPLHMAVTSMVLLLVCATLGGCGGEAADGKTKDKANDGAAVDFTGNDDGANDDGANDDGANDDGANDDAVDAAAVGTTADTTGKNDAVTTCAANKKTCRDLSTLRSCVNGQWQESTCGAEQVCSDLACRAKVCTPAAKRCTADLKAAETCAGRGASWLKTLCQIDEACVAGACLKLTCKPGKKTCGDAATVLTCKPAGQGQSAETCKAGFGCDPGYGKAGAQAFCKAQVCTPGERFCVKNKALECTKDGLEAKQLDNCNKNDTLGKPMACKLGQCVSVQCEPGSFACLGWTQLGKCKTDGSAYAASDCGDKFVCSKGACKAKACAPGEAYCEGKIAKKCDALGAVATVTADCATSGSDCVKGACAKVVCSLGAKRCNPDFTGFELCETGGYGWKLSLCKTGQACDGGVCKAVVCKAGTATCNGNIPTACNGGGTAVVAAKDCGKKVCVAGDCKSTNCTAGATTCKDAATQWLCNSNGVGGVAKACPTKSVCAAGVCKKVVCAPSSAWCTGTVGKTCALDGMSIIATADCSKLGQVCKEGGCVDKGCGDGQCDKAGGETCSTCTKDCGVCPFDGCTARGKAEGGKAGCDKCACESCVCDWDPSCCTGAWSGSCANLCKTACTNTCG